MFCEYCGKKLEDGEICSCCSVETENLNTQPEEVKCEKSSTYYAKSKKSVNFNRIIPMFIILVAIVIAVIFFNNRSEKDQIIEGAVDNSSKTNSTDESKLEEDIVFSITPENNELYFDLIDFSSIIEKIGREKIKEAIDDVRYAETDNVYVEAIFALEKKSDAKESDYFPELQDNAVIVIGEYTNTKTSEKVYGYCVFGDVTADSNAMSFEWKYEYQRLENSLEAIADMIQNDKGYNFYSIMYLETFKTELNELCNEPFYKKLQGKTEYSCIDTMIGAESNFFVEFLEDKETMVLIHGTGLIDAEASYVEECSDDSCMIYHSVGDGIALYKRLKETKHEDLVSKYSHLEGLTSEQVEECGFTIRYYPEQDIFEFEGLGPYEFFNGSYSISSGF